MAKRSPILGYNHNIRHRGLVFHIQTEDSGVDNPHIFTHLFRGGVILSTRKLNYDPESSEDTVKGLMQAQHKAVMKGLKHGEFEDKIDAYLGDEPGLEPRAQPGEGAGDWASEVEPAGSAAPRARPGGDVSAAFDAISDQESAAAAASPPPVRAGEYAQHRKSHRIRTEAQDAPVQRQPPPKIAPPRAPPARNASVPRAPTGRRAAGGGVVVSRPAVIVGAPPKVVGQPSKPTPARSAPRARKARDEGGDGIFGQDLISEKSLDEVILAYLSEDGGED